MTSVEDIYRVTLEQLAEEGNEKARLALAMAKKLPVSNGSQNAICELQVAERELNAAIDHNSTKWTSATDRAIGRAHQAITRAIIQIK